MKRFYLKQLFSFETRFQELKKFETPKSFKDDKLGDIDLTRVQVAGWIDTIRYQKGGDMAFVTLTDGFDKMLQITAEREKIGKEQFEMLKTLSRGCSAQFVGVLVKSPAKGQVFELVCKSLKLFGKPHLPEEYPLMKTGKKQRLTLDYLRQYPHLRVRARTGAAVFRVRDTLKMATHSYFHDEDFIEVAPPTITASDCEGAGEMFKVTTLPLPESGKGQVVTVKETVQEDDFFRQAAYLTVSRQIDLEPFALAMRAVYCFGPTFRAEESKTARHLAEFEMVEPEVCFVTLDQLMDYAEGYTKRCIQDSLDMRKSDIELLCQVAKWQHSGTESTEKVQVPTKEEFITMLKQYILKPFVRVTYTDAIEILLECGEKFQEKVFWGIDLGSEHEKYLTDVHFKKPVFLTHYPEDIKSFYMKISEGDQPRVPKGKKTVDCFDLLVPGIGELIGGSMREEDYDTLVTKMKRLGMELEPYKAYLDIRKFGSVPHGGFGLGFERLVRFVTGLQQIRDCIPHPRYVGHLE